jgi:hypothetical protein
METTQPSEWALARTKHGGYLGGKERPEHYVWRTMMARCYRPTANGYEYYGAKGISVCKRWHTYANFIADMGERPSADHSIERKNTRRGYSPANCVWATRSDQQKNKTTTKRYTEGVFTGTLVECAAMLGISKELAHWRWKQWGTFERNKEWHRLPKVA